MEFDMKEIFQREFADDPLIREIKLVGLENEIYNEKILSIHPERTYSTIEASTIIERNDSTLRNYFRTELLEYIAPEKVGRYYRLNYKSLFKFHLILLLVEKANKSTNDISILCGLKALISEYEVNHSFKRRENTPVNTLEQSNLSQEINQIKKMMSEMVKNQVISEEKEKLNNLELEYLKLDREIETIEREIEKTKLETKIINAEKKYLKILDYSLRKTAINKKRGLFDLFKFNDMKEENLEQVLQDAIKMSEQKEDIKVQVDKSHDELIEKLEQRDKLIQKINKQKEVVKQLPQSKSLFEYKEEETEKFQLVLDGEVK